MNELDPHTYHLLHSIEIQYVLLQSPQREAGQSGEITVAPGTDRKSVV